MSSYTGEIAALFTSLFFSFSSLLFTFATRKFGAMVVNRARLLLAVILLMITHLILYQQLIPTSADPQRWFWLGISGIVGLVLGDIFLFHAYACIGARLSMLMMSLAPVIAVFIAWLFLSETPSIQEIFGILVTIGGIAWVVLGKNSKTNSVENCRYGRGILYGLGAATGQALGLVLSKKGLGSDFPALSGNVIRMITAAVVLWGLTFIQGQARFTLRQLASSPPSLWYIIGGMIGGPFLGVTFSLYAVQHANVGIASTLMALPPVLLLPISYVFVKERFGWGAIAGTLVAIAGVSLLFLH